MKYPSKYLELKANVQSSGKMRLEDRDAISDGGIMDILIYDDTFEIDETYFMLNTGLPYKCLGFVGIYHTSRQIGSFNWNNKLKYPEDYDTNEAAKQAANEKWNKFDDYIEENRQKIMIQIVERYPTYSI